MVRSDFSIAFAISVSDYERWSAMTKQELMADTSGQVVRIPHQGDWFGQLKRELGIK